MTTCVGTLIALLFLFQNLALAYTPVQITSHSASQGRPDIHGDIITWKDFRAGNYDIYKYDIGTSSMDGDLVEDNPAYQQLPITNGFVILWQDNRSGNWDIYKRVPLLGFTSQPLVSGPGNQGISDISGNTVVYVDDSSGSNDVYTIDVNSTSGTGTPVATGPSNQWQPRISGDRVVWQDNRNGKWDVYMYDLGGGGEQPVAVGPGDHTVCDIDGDRVVWQRLLGGQYDIRVKNLTSGVEQPITDDAAYQWSPRISGDLVVWIDYRNDANPGDTYYDYDIYMYDLTAGLESPLADGPSIQAYPAIDRERVVWEDTAAGSYDVWMTTVPDETPPGISEFAPSDGSTSCPSPTVSATLSDNRTGVDTGSVTMLFDGTDVTGSAVITETSVQYQPGTLDPGPHSVSLTVADMAGNPRTGEWQFTTTPPELSITPQLSITGLFSFWASGADYQNRLLSVNFTLNNALSGSDAQGVSIVAAPSSLGVVPVDLPSAAHDIASGGQEVITAKYLIPPGVGSFTTSIFVSCSDACGGQYDIPGPPPA